MDFLYGIYRNFIYIFYVVGLLVITPLIYFVGIFFGQRAANNIPRYYAKLLCFFIPIRISVEGRELIEKEQSYVVVMNHRSLMDIVAIYAAMEMDIRWIMKKELTKIPLFGYAAILLGNIPIDRKNTVSAMKSISKAKEMVVDGTSVAFFPEGTRYNDRILGSFKKGAFHFALDVNLPVLPVAITGTDKIMPVKTHRFKPGKVKIVIHPPVDTGYYSKVTVNQFSDEVFGTIYNTLEKSGLES